MFKAIASVGPVSVAIYVTSKFQNYASGVFIDTTCNGLGINHAIVLVGYGSDINGTNYYIMRNSWSNKWGIILKIVFFKIKFN